MMTCSREKFFIAFFFPFAVLALSMIIAHHIPNSKDYFNYISLITEEKALTVFDEPGLILLNSILSHLFNSKNSFLIYISIIAIAAKYVLLAKIANWHTIPFLLIMLVYLARFFPIHDLTQIKTALSVLFLLSMITANATSAKFVNGALAILMHNGAIVFLIFYSLARYSHSIFIKLSNPANFVLALLSFIAAFSLLVFSFAGLLVEFFLTGSDLFAQYHFAEYGILQVNPFNPTLMLDGLLVIIFFTRAELRHNKENFSLALVVLFGVIFFVNFFYVPSIAFRVRELLSIGILFVFSGLLNSKNTFNKRIAVFFALIQATYFFYTFFLSEHRILNA